jgi:hypothetical protein
MPYSAADYLAKANTVHKHITVLSQLFISNLPMSAHAYNAEQRRQDRKAEVEAIDIISVRLWW